MRVLFLYKDYYPVLGGIENHVRLLATGLMERGVQVQVLVTNTDRKTVRTSIDGIPVTKTARQANVSSAPISLQYFPEVWRQEKGTDITHAHFPYPPAEVAHLLSRRSKRFVITYHSDIVKQKVLGTVYRPFLRLVLRQADLLTVSNPTYIRTSPFLQPHAHKCRVIHHGQDLRRFAATEERRTAAARLRAQYGDGPLVLFVGRLRHYKGVDVLIRAMQHVTATLLVAGTGPMQADWQAVAADLGLGQRVHFLGEVSEEMLLNLYHAAGLFVLPSTNRAETWGAVQIEAMACGLPLICTELGTGTSYVNRHGETGLVVPPHRPDALADAINQIIGDPQLRREMGMNGMKRAQEQFSKEAMIDQLLKFYEEAMQGTL